MRISSRIDGSICGAILFLHRPASSRSSTSWSAALGFPVSIGPCYSNSGGPERRYHSYRTTRHDRHTTTSSLSSHQHHQQPRPLLPVPALRNVYSIRFESSTPGSCRNHTAAALRELDSETEPEPKPRRPSPLSKERLLALVDAYDGEEVGSVDQYLESARDPYMRGYAPPDAAFLAIAKASEEVAYPASDEVLLPDEHTQETLFELNFAVKFHLFKPNNHQIDLNRIYELYMQLPEPRIMYLTGSQRHDLLKVLGQPDKLDSASMLRFFAVIADVKNSGIPLLQSQWNRVIHFAGKYVGKVTEVENEAALKLWREMEIEAGVPASDMTFNILFDIASKAGNFTLAEMLFREMERRGHRYNRHHYVSLIHFFGLKLETGGMRAAYREMVEAGEAVDTVVMNAMISGLLRSGEESAADAIYERMKRSNMDLAELPARTKSHDRAVTQVLHMFSKLGREHPELQQRAQEMALIAPDLQTYRLLINHYGVERGELGIVINFINDMKYFQIPMHGAIFLALFKGFARHGALYRSPWTADRLESIWEAFLDAYDSNVSGIEIQTWLACSALRAFDACSTIDRVMEVYELLNERWHLGHDDKQFMIAFLAKIINKGGRQGRDYSTSGGTEPWDF
ncbi:hypothetical protein QBC35DRAFT_491955 [Podospora australis]|uniref:Pentatricopeptide repeat-containing protein n=1 Tax=Podospora australis TaxID=1536484 RepID=A0AAN6WYC3_9PEZI|nr:hypothetical protein QBC35DRAFT_491955 [Podospora australis]